MQQPLDCLFINPRDLVGANPYLKLANLAGTLRSKRMLVQILDPAPSNLSHQQILEVIQQTSPKIICLAAFPSTLPDCYQTVNLIKERFPTITLVLEGYHINADPEIIRHLNIPYGFRGDAEFSFTTFCQAILKGEQPPADLPGMVSFINGTLQTNPAAVITDLDSIPLPAYDLLPIGKYYSASTNKRYMMFFSTRGCPYDCYFCASAAQMKYRYMSTEIVLKHLHVLVRELRVEWIEFMDLTFTVSRKRTEELCQAIQDSGLQFQWGCETRADKIDEPLLLKMKAAGCVKITFGVETGSEQIRARSGKQITNQRFLEVFDLCRKHGIKTMANFIFGHPDETIAEMKQTIHFARQLKPFNAFFTRMVPMPDVEIYQRGVASGEIPADIWLRYMKGEISHPVYYPPTVTPAQMDKLYQTAYKKFYFSLNALRNYSPLLLDPNFLRRTIPIFLRLSFGKPVFK